MTLKILVYMPKWHYGFDTRMFGLVSLLRQRGYDVDFRVATLGLLARQESSLPCVPFDRLMEEDFQALGAKSVDSAKDFYKSTLSADIILMGNALKGQARINEIIHRSGKPFIVCDDTHDILLGTYRADLAAIPGEFDKAFLTANKLMDPDKLVVTGSLHMDEIRSEANNPSWSSFCEKYGLDTEKRLAIFATSASQGHDKWTQQRHQQIISILQQSKQFQPILRLHPNDSAGHKRQVSSYADTTKDSAEQLYPDVPKLFPEDRIAAMNHASTMLSILSMTSYESSLFRMNCLMVDHMERMLHPRYRDRGVYPARMNTGFGMYEDENTMFHQRLLKEGKVEIDGLFNGRFEHRFPFRWLGGACTVKELPDILESEEILHVDEDIRNQHLSDYWFKDDGLAHVRVADLVEMVQERPEIARKLYQSRGRRLWQLGGYASWLAEKPLKYPYAKTRHIGRVLIKWRR